MGGGMAPRRRAVTAKLKVMFKRLPPKKPLNSLANIVLDWNYRFGKDGAEHHRRDHVTDYCAAAPNFDVAVDRACASRAENGKMHNHQSRVKEKDRREFAKRIKRFKSVIFRDKDFDRLYDILDEVKPSGIGPVTTYDVATRLAAFLDLDIESLYLHAGVRIGWDLLHGGKEARERIERSDLPRAFAKLPTDEIEDLLCTYRDHLKGARP
jgi:hypothetical protein